MTNSILMFVFISVLKAHLLSNNSLHFRYFKKIVQADTLHGYQEGLFSYQALILKNL